LGQIDTIIPQNGATTDISIAGPGFETNTFGTGPGLIYKDGIGSSQARVVYSSFGLEGMGIEYYKFVNNNVTFYYARNQRPNILHNVISYLRSGSVTGTIKALSTSGVTAPLSGATVYLVPNGGTLPASITRQTFSATSTSNGSYHIDGVEPGGYNVVAYDTGYTRSISNTPFVVSSDQTSNTSTTSLTLNQTPNGSISGQIVDANGNPIALPGVAIAFISVDGAEVTGTTNSTGAYTISTPASGGPDDTYSGTATLTNGSYTFAPVSGVVVNSSANTPNINFTATPVPGTLVGLVTDETNAPVARATITVKKPDGTVAATATTFTPAVADPDPAAPSGTLINYQITTLPQLPSSQQYTVTITPPTNFTLTIGESASQPVTITSQGYSTQNFTLQSNLGGVGGLVEGSDTNGGPLVGATVTISNVTNTYTTTTYAPAQSPTSTPPRDGDGNPLNFSLDVPAGTYTVTITAPNYVTQTFTGVAVTVDAFTRLPSTTSPTMPVILQNTLGTFGGLVTNSATGQPLTGATVTITGPGGSQVMGSPFTTGTVSTSPADSAGNTHQINFITGSLPAVDASGNPIIYTVTVADQGAGTAAKPDYIPQTFQLNGANGVPFLPGPFTDHDTALTTAYGTLGGLVSDSLTPAAALAGASITVTDQSTNTVVATISSSGAITTPGAPTGNGDAQNYSATLYNGTYTVTASASDHTIVTVKDVPISGGAYTEKNFSLVSTIGKVGGLVEDSVSGQVVGGATVTITDASGNAVTTFTTSTTESAAPSPGTGQVNYSGSLTAVDAAGNPITYIATVTRNGFQTTPGQSFTVTGNGFTRVDFIGSTNGLQAIHTFQSGYNFFSVPYDYASIGISFDQLFGTLNTGTVAAPSAGSNRSHIFVWSPDLVQYIQDPTAPADGLHLGQGYWVYLLKASEVTVAGPTAAGASVSVALHTGWNMIGVPSTSAISVSNLTFSGVTGTVISFTNAASSTYRLISPTLYGYNGSSYTAVTSGGSLSPWQAYWIYAYSGVTINIPTS
jgi:hypothetical protein